MATRLYLRALPPGSGESPTQTTPLHTAYGILGGYNASYIDPADYLLDEIAGTNTSGSSLSANSVATTNTQWAVLGRWSSPALAAQTIPSQTWTVAVGAYESNGMSNMQVLFGAYVYRPSTQSVVGHILLQSDGQQIDYRGDLTYEVESTSPGTIKPGTASGDAVTTQAGDIFVVEVGYRSQQGKSNSYVNTLYFDGTQVVTGTATASNPDVASYIESPYTFQFDGGGGGPTPVSQDSDLRWSLEAATTPVSQDSDLRWSSLTALEQSSDLRWSMDGTVFSSLDLRWSVSEEVVNLGTVVASSAAALQPHSLTVTTSTDGLLVLYASDSPWEPLQTYQTTLTFDPGGLNVVAYPIVETAYQGWDNNASGATYAAAFFFAQNEIPSNTTATITVANANDPATVGNTLVAYPLNCNGVGAHVRQVAAGYAENVISVTPTFDQATIGETLVAAIAIHNNNNQWDTLPLGVTDMNIATGTLGGDSFAACHALNDPGRTSLAFADDSPNPRMAAVAVEIMCNGNRYSAGPATVTLQNLVGDINDLAEETPYTPDANWIEAS